MKKLLVRTATGAAYVAVMIFCTMFRPWTLLTLIVVLALLAVGEFAHICCADGKHAVNRVLLFCSAIAFPVAIYLSFRLEESNILLLLSPHALILLLAFLHELYAHHEDPIGNLGLIALAQVYIVVPLAMLSLLAFAPFDAEERAFWTLPLALYVFLWLNDSGAYLIGSWLGKHKLFPRISPGKTWEGSIGGAIVALASALVFAHFFPFMSVWRWIALALVVVVFGTWGDLIESLIKRTLGIKDSGALLPGHGGILDRIDSMLLAIPAVVIYLCI